MNIAEEILQLAEQRGKDKTICPSEVARKLSADNWRSLMEEIRKTAFELRDEGKIAIMQNGKEIAGNNVIGPIRIKIK